MHDNHGSQGAVYTSFASDLIASVLTYKFLGSSLVSLGDKPISRSMIDCEIGFALIFLDAVLY